MSQKEYLLILIERKYGPLNQVLIEELTWLDLDDQQQLITTLDPTYRNYSNWHSILTARNPEGVYTGLSLNGRLNKEGVPVISADSKPKLLESIDLNTLSVILQHYRNPPSIFQRLFK